MQFCNPSSCLFSQRADAKLAHLESSLQELSAVSNAVAEYFCEDPATFKLDECCAIFHSFCKRFDTAVRVRIETHLELDHYCCSQIYCFNVESVATS